MTIKYTEEDTQYLRSEYLADPTRATVDRLAVELQREGGARSVIAKLSDMGIYVKRNVRFTKAGEVVMRRSDLVKEIGDMFGIDLGTLANKYSIRLLYNALKDPDQVRAHLIDLEYELNENKESTT